MRTIVLFACFGLACLPSIAQDEWLMVINGPAFVDTESVSIDPDDNALVVGNFDNGVNLGGIIYDGSGSFLIKLSKDGTPLWHRVMRYGTGETRVLRKVDTDASGNVYIAGNFSQSVTVEGHNYSSSYPNNGYVAKFDPQGNVQWTKVIVNVQQFHGMKVNTAGQILLYSMQYGVIGVDDIIVAAGINSVGVMLNSSGTLLWAKRLGDLTRYTTSPRACAIDNEGNAYFHGVFTGTLTLDDQEAKSNYGNYNFFIAKVNAEGVCQWISVVDRNAPVANETSNPPDGLLAERGALEVDEHGNTYLGGYSWMGIRVGSLSLNDEGTCIVKFDATGKAVWAKLGEAISLRGTVENIVVDDGKVYVSGLRPGGFYFSVYDTDGIFTRTGGTTRFPSSVPGGLDVNSEHQVYLCGRIAYGAARLQGFVLNYGMPTNLPRAAGVITAPTSACPSDELSVVTDAIDFAVSYEWEINRGSSSFIVETFAPELHLKLSDYQIINDFSIRVRGKSEVGVGTYSDAEVIRVEKPVAAPSLEITCGVISIKEPSGVTTLDWYFNNTVAPEYGRINTSITPDVEGVYHVTVDDVCGPVASNKIIFTKTMEAPTLLISCGQISVEHPEGVITVDWYFNGSLVEEYGQLNFSITPNKNGNYYAQIDNGCGAVPSKGVTFVAEEPKQAPTLIVSCTEISIEEPQAGVTVDWFFNDVRAVEYGRTATSIKPNNEGRYHVAITDACGIIVSDDVTFEFLRAENFELPNVITPNGDVYNQKFVVDERLDSPRVVIFNRWGAEVYADEKYGNTWEGENLPPGVYYYQLNSKCLSAPVQGILSIAR